MLTPLTNALFARALRQATRDMFDGIDLATRDSAWVDQDSFDAGLLASAKYLLGRADLLDAGILDADV